MLAPHNCKSDTKGNQQARLWQEKRYGQGQRVWTTNKDDIQLRCTVCGSKK